MCLCFAWSSVTQLETAQSFESGFEGLLGSTRIMLSLRIVIPHSSTRSLGLFTQFLILKFSILAVGNRQYSWPHVNSTYSLSLVTISICHLSSLKQLLGLICILLSSECGFCAGISIPVVFLESCRLVDLPVLSASILHLRDTVGLRVLTTQKFIQDSTFGGSQGSLCLFTTSSHGFLPFIA